MGLGVIITIAVNIVITVVLLTILLYYYHSSFECDTFPSFWCYTDWKCPGYDPNDDQNIVMYNRFGLGITNRNVTGYLLSAMDALSDEDDAKCKYYYGTTQPAIGSYMCIKNRSSTKSPCSGVRPDGSSYACSPDGGPSQPDSIYDQENPYNCVCSAPLGPDGNPRGYCISNGQYNNCTLGPGGDTSNCGISKCLPLNDKMCNRDSFSSVSGTCLQK